MDENPKSNFRLIPVTKWSEYHPWPTIGGLRYLIFNENQNGFHSCIVRIGRRVLIDETAFFEWAHNQEKQHQEYNYNWEGLRE